MVVCRLQALSALLTDRSIFIYGTGRVGRLVRRVLTLFANLPISGFIDTWQSGSVDGLPVLTLEEFRRLRTADVAVILSAGAIEEIFANIRDLKLFLCLDGRPLFDVCERLENVTDETLFRRRCTAAGLGALSLSSLDDFQLEKVLISNNRSISDIEIERSIVVAKNAAELVQQREVFLNSSDCDRDFVLPDANWNFVSKADRPEDFGSLYKAAAAGNASLVAHLRMYVQVYTGFNMLALDRESQPDGVNVMSAAIDDVHNNQLERYRLSWPLEWRRLTAGVPHRAIFAPPRMLGEVGFDIDGVVVNHDTLAYQERLTLLHRAGMLDWLDRRLANSGHLRILEIGGGYGALAFWFKRAYPQTTYTIIDLPESLMFSSLYLSLTRPDLDIEFGAADVPYGLRFVSNHLANTLMERFDLVINTLSMSEMTAHQVRGYANMLKSHWLADGGYFFEQNQDNRHLGWLSAKDVLAEILPHGRRINTNSVLREQGFANLWSMTNKFPDSVFADP